MIKRALFGVMVIASLVAIFYSMHSENSSLQEMRDEITLLKDSVKQRESVILVLQDSLKELAEKDTVFITQIQRIREMQSERESELLSVSDNEHIKLFDSLTNLIQESEPTTMKDSSAIVDIDRIKSVNIIGVRWIDQVEINDLLEGRISVKDSQLNIQDDIIITQAATLEDYKGMIEYYDDIEENLTEQVLKERRQKRLVAVISGIVIVIALL